MDKLQREYRILARELGFTLTKGGGSHYQFRRDGCETVFAPGSPSDWRTMRNLKKELERSKAGRLSAFRGARF